MRLARIAVVVGVLACSGDRAPSSDTAGAPGATSQTTNAPTRAAEDEPTQWTLREVARRLTDGGLVVTDSGRTGVRHSFLAVEGKQLLVSGSELQVFVYPDPPSRRADSERLDPVRVAPPDMDIDWVAPAHLIASGNLLAIHLASNERLAERVRLILEAWHATP